MWEVVTAGPGADCVEATVTSTGEKIFLRKADPHAALRQELRGLEEQCQAMADMLGIKDEQEERQLIRMHIDKLHRYNEIKDLTQALLGKLAVLEGTTTKALYSRYDLDLAD